VAEPSRTTQLFAAVIAVAVGALVGVMIYRYPEGLHAPAWVGYMAASSFVFAGFCLFAAAADVPWLQRWLGLAAGIPLLALAGISPWLAKIAPMLGSNIQSPFEISPTDECG